jgi:hypothetical protein
MTLHDLQLDLHRASQYTWPHYIVLPFQPDLFGARRLVFLLSTGKLRLLVCDWPFLSFSWESWRWKFSPSEQRLFVQVGLQWGILSGSRCATFG